MTTPEAQRLTAAFMLFVTAQIFAFDVLMAWWFGREASISHLMASAFERQPYLAAALIFWLGVWVGHTYLFHGPVD